MGQQQSRIPEEQMDIYLKTYDLFWPGLKLKKTIEPILRDAKSEKFVKFSTTWTLIIAIRSKWKKFAQFQNWKSTLGTNASAESFRVRFYFIEAFSWRCFLGREDGRMTFDNFLHMISVFSENAPLDVKVEYCFRLYGIDHQSWSSS